MADKAVSETLRTRLSARLAELVNLYLDESDPKAWPGDKTAQDRGDRFWHKKNAEATGRLAMRTLELITFEVSDAPLEGEALVKRNAAIDDESAYLARQGVAMLKRWKERRNAR